MHQESTAVRSWSVEPAPEAERERARITASDGAVAGALLPEGPRFISRPKAWTQGYTSQRTRSQDKPKQERDSLRSRSRQGRPGSRKYKRWQHATLITGRLRQVMYDSGEDLTDTDGEAEATIGPVYKPSAFYKLLEREGADAALETLKLAEARKDERQPRVESEEAAAARRLRLCVQSVRRVFAGKPARWIGSDDAMQRMLAGVECAAVAAFTDATEPEAELEVPVALRWDPDDPNGSELIVESGPRSDATGELQVSGLAPNQRKLVHMLARAMGLHSESGEADPNESQVKTVALRPPRREGGRAWVPPPLSVLKILLLDRTTAVHRQIGAPIQKELSKENEAPEVNRPATEHKSDTGLDESPKASEAAQ